MKRTRPELNGDIAHVTSILLWPRIACRREATRHFWPNVVKMILPVSGSAVQELITMPNSAYLDQLQNSPVSSYLRTEYFQEHKKSYQPHKMTYFMPLKQNIPYPWPVVYIHGNTPRITAYHFSVVLIHVNGIHIPTTVYPKKYAHGFCFAVLFCGYTLTDFPHIHQAYFTGTVAI